LLLAKDKEELARLERVATDLGRQIKDEDISISKEKSEIATDTEKLAAKQAEEAR
jgi:hypothetical protein